MPFETAIASGHLDCSTLGGLFFSLPRELRDEIYRYIVKGRYLSIQSWMFPTYYKHSPAFHKAELAIFRVSKATFDEATSIFYSESVFIYHIDLLQWSITCLPGSASSRIRNVEFDFDTLSFHNIHYDWASYDHKSRELRDQIERTLNATLDKFTGPSIPRNTMLIKLQPWSPNSHEKLYEHLFRRLKAFVGFRMVTVDAGPRPDIFEGEVWIKGYRNLCLRLKEEMVSTMGPTTVRQVGLSICLEFQPLKHMQANLRTQVDTAGMKISGLDLEADRSEQGE